MISSDLVADEFLLSVLQNSRQSSPELLEKKHVQAAQFLIRSEESILGLLESSERNEIEFPPLNSFYRRIIHALARKYDLVHRVEATNVFNSSTTLRKIYLMKPVNVEIDRIPLLKCSDWLERSDNESKFELTVLKSHFTPNSNSQPTQMSIQNSQNNSNVPKIKILKRAVNSNAPNANADTDTNANNTVETKESLEEREARYQAIRDRIFEGFNPENEEEGINSCNNYFSVDTTSANISVDSNLNPDAKPYSGEFLHPLQSKTMTFDHIFTLSSTATSEFLSLSELSTFLESLKHESSQIFKSAQLKVHQIPAKFAILIISKDSKASWPLSIPIDEDKFILKPHEVTLLE